jgi:hypothetical protein
LPSPLRRTRRIDAPYGAPPLQDVCHDALRAKVRVIGRSSARCESTAHDKRVSLQQKRMTRAGQSLAFDAENRGDSAQSELADQLL